MKITGIEALEKELRKFANLDDVKDVVKLNGAEMQKNAMKKAPVDTGTLKRYIMLSNMDGGFTARVNSLVNYSAYVEHGTRYQTAQPFIRPSLKEQEIKFRNDLLRLMK